MGNDFYRIVPGDSMTYSCAYWPQPDDGAIGGLHAAQQANAIWSHASSASPGMRVLEVAGGWERSPARRLPLRRPRRRRHCPNNRPATHGPGWSREGGHKRVETRLQDYRDVADGPFDAVASIGMAEHVSAQSLPAYTAGLFDLLLEEGRLLNHAISRRPGPRPEPSRTSFIDRYISPRVNCSRCPPSSKRSRPPASRSATSNRCASTGGLPDPRERYQARGPVGG